MAKGKAAYDYLFTTMRYDKTGTGWGRGDAVWACDAKHGNCTDFHSPFIGMMRADDIPARFDIGFPLPENKDKGDIAGYHCWAEFFARNIGWVPVDISEAWKAKEKAGYFFGSVDANRVQFSTGRDITLVAQAGWSAAELFRLSLRRSRWQNLRRDRQAVQLRRSRAEHCLLGARAITSPVDLAATGAPRVSWRR